ncbi:hypothetical protein GY45DRAFT_1432462 [Cubamyces sp. BRFM 1775]|nr:hypothetical protein GY45DRAFT_1432462 [Cubamyces sp. BRFM 1775]
MYFIREALPSIVSPTLRFLDLWSSRYDPDRPDLYGIQECVAQLVKTGTPRLERINVFVKPHRPSAKFHWPRLSSSFALSIDGNDLYKDPALPDIHFVWTELSKFPMEYFPTWSDLEPFNPIYSYALSPETLDDDPSEDGTDLESYSHSGDRMGDLEDDVDEDDTDSMSEWGDQSDEASSDGVLSPIGGTLTQEHQVDRETMLAMFQDSQEGGALLSNFDEEE